MKVIVITANTSWYVYNFRKNTILALVKANYRVIAVAPWDEYSAKFSELGCEYRHISIDQGGTNAIKDVLTFFAFFRLYQNLKPTVILNYTPKNNIYSTLAGNLVSAASINNIAGLGVLFINESFASRIARLLYKYSQSKANKIFFQNRDDKAFFVSNGLAPATLTDLLPGSGVDLCRFRISVAKDDGVVRFILVARMLFDKGIGQYVEAARRLKSEYPRVEFNLLGFLDDRNPSAVGADVMEAWVREGVVNYLGTSDCVEKVVADMDCVVLPSYYREGVPKSLLEAGAMGKPIITTRSVGCRETVDEGINGLLCNPKDVEGLVVCLRSMIEMGHEGRTKMGLQSRKKMEREFDENLVIHKYMGAVEDVVREKAIRN